MYVAFICITHLPWLMIQFLLPNSRVPASSGTNKNFLMLPIKRANWRKRQRFWLLFRFESLSGHRPTYVRFWVGFLSLSKRIPRRYLKTGQVTSKYFKILYLPFGVKHWVAITSLNILRCLCIHATKKLRNVSIRLLSTIFPRCIKQLRRSLVTLLLECTSSTHTWQSPPHWFRVNQLTMFPILVINNSWAFFYKAMEIDIGWFKISTHSHMCITWLYDLYHYLPSISYAVERALNWFCVPSSTV
jgi:hypothetical protein